MDPADSGREIDYEKLTKNMPQTTFASIRSLLKQNLAQIEESVRIHESEYNRIVETMRANEKDYETAVKSKPVLDEQYLVFQKLKSYLTDYIDCHREKVIIEINSFKIETLFCL